MQLLIEAVILGLVQGLTEFIPVSSSGHLIIADELLGFEAGSFAFDTLLNVGTLLALGLYFRTEIAQLLKAVFKPKEGKLGWLIALATLPAVTAGWFIQDSPRLVPIVIFMLIAVGVLMLLADRRLGKRIEKEMNFADALLIGLAQVLAFIPGTSRSGITMVAGLFRGLSREAAARFSFLLALPVLGGGVLKVALEPGTAAAVSASHLPFVVGIIASFLSGYAAIAFMLRFLSRHGLSLFAWYRIILAAILLIVTLI